VNNEPLQQKTRTMARIKINKDGETLYYTGYDQDGMHLSNNKNDAKCISGGYYVKAELDFIKFHFKTSCPQVKNATIEEEEY